MQAIRRWLAGPAPSVTLGTTASTTALARDDTRRELLRMAVRDTLRKHGIPVEWVSAETSSRATRERERGMHLCLVLREWQPRLLEFTVALQKAIRSKLIRLDPLSPAWLAGISWKFEPHDEDLCPPLPPAHGWQAQAPAPVAPERPRPLLQDDAAGLRAAAAERADFRPTQPLGLR
jgi:hypothetical protein